MSLGVALNPDFSQVEADAVQLDVNNRFALTYPEKRPFFLEGAELFETPMGSVFTRTVADPRAGVKLTGRVGRTSLGVLAARDDVTNVLIPVVTVMGLQFGSLLGGSVVVETVFAWPGLGRLAYDGITSRDFPVIQAVVLTTAAIVAAVNLGVDLLYAFIDPRVRYAR